MTRFVHFHHLIVALIALLVSLVLLSTAAPVHAGGMILDCDNDAAFSSALASGGDITFNCGNANLEATIGLSSTKTISLHTTIDGGGKVTLSGSFSNRLFVVNSGIHLTLKNITLVNGYNPDSNGGGAVFNSGTLALDNVTIKDMPDSGFNGGAISTTGSLNIANSVFNNNKATNGGAIYANGSGAIVSINTSRFEGNKATGTVQNADGFGGAIYAKNGGQVNIGETLFFKNSANDGGALYIGNPNETLNLFKSELRENSALSKGGGILNGSTASLTDVTINGNGITNAFSGGAIFNYANLTLSRVTLNNNNSYSGAGITNFLGTANLTNVTLSGNIASAYGGGIDNYEATMNLMNVTLNSNSHGILNQNNPDTHLTLQNVIVANSKTGKNCDFHVAPDASDNNLSTDATCNFSAGGGRDSVKIKLGKLETNGGWTLTHRLPPGSAAIDNGKQVNNPKDQREIGRPQGAAFDVGAVEFVPCAAKPTKPVLLSPTANQNVLTQGGALLDWAGPDCVKTFSVLVRRDSKTGTIVFSKSKIKRTQVMTGALSPEHNYFWQVTACNASGCAASKWRKFQYQAN